MKLLNSIKVKLFLVAATALSSLATLAQDGKKLDIDIDVNKGEAQWYAQPWIWVVGGAVFILLLVALLRGGRKA
jgi:hypothetical protein